MKKYNLSKIMKRAWEIKRQDTKNIFSFCLCVTWSEAKKGADLDKEIRRLIETYKIVEVEGDRIKAIIDPKKVPSDEIEKIRNCKLEILSFLRGEKKKAEEAHESRNMKIQAIEGLDEIESCMDAWARFNEDFNAMMETGRGYMTVKKPEINVQELRAKYPVADAYIKARKEARKTNYELSAIGRKALDRIIEGEDYKKVKMIWSRKLVSLLIPTFGINDKKAAGQLPTPPAAPIKKS